jgi:uncharacterized membrane protein
VRALLERTGRLFDTVNEWLDVVLLGVLGLSGVAVLFIAVAGGVSAVQAGLIVALFVGLAIIWLFTSTALDKLRSR